MKILQGNLVYIVYVDETQIMFTFRAKNNSYIHYERIAYYWNIIEQKVSYRILLAQMKSSKAVHTNITIEGLIILSTWMWFDLELWKGKITFLIKHWLIGTFRNSLFLSMTTSIIFLSLLFSSQSHISFPSNYFFPFLVPH